jgi:DNA replication protein DnaC
MTEELEQLLKNLKLRRMLEIYDEQLRAAKKEDVTYSELLTRLARAQWHARQEGALEWRIQRANLPERWSFSFFSGGHPEARLYWGSPRPRPAFPWQ